MSNNKYTQYGVEPDKHHCSFMGQNDKSKLEAGASRLNEVVLTRLHTSGLCPTCQ